VATKKDLVEAYSFSRRRLVTAFLSGAPGGREVEPSRPGRTVVGGVALAVLLVAGAAIASVLAARTEEDWNQQGLVVSRQQAAPYVILGKEDPPTLIPVINITSAQLILGSTIVPKYVDQDVIEDQTPGEPIGIANAPQVLPRPQQFIESGWTACTEDGRGIQVDVSTSKKVSVPAGGGVVVKHGDQYWVIGRSGTLDDVAERRAYRYPLPDADLAGNLLAGIGLDSAADAPEVPEEWLNLFPQGATLGLESFGVQGFHKPLDVAGMPAGAKVGDVVQNADGTGYFLTQAGERSTLDPFALQVYMNSSYPGHADWKPRVLEADDVPPVNSAPRAYDGAHWPDGRLEEVRGPLCARLDAGHGRLAKVDLAGDPRDGAEVADTVPAGEKELTIQRGRGAFVRVGDWDDTTSTSTYVIDPRGKSYAIVGADSIANLGYDDVGESTIPDTWLKLFASGVSLSTSKALCPPDTTDATTDPAAGPSGDASAAPSASASSGPEANGCQPPADPAS
jgi:type VII secretion protein EccB